MLFNSIQFAVFFPVVFLLYWFATGKKYKIQNILLLISSYYFYGCWNWHFLFLLIFSTGLDYFTGLMMADASNKRKKQIWFWLSVCVNLGFLGVFKYYNFFIDSFADLLATFGLKAHFSTLQVILPVGISFYTFHGLSYVIDIYNNRIKPERNFINYSVFVCFFPLLVAGPIERATHLLPQITKDRVFDYTKAVDGLRQILWGLFKKIVIADNCAIIVNNVFDNYKHQSASNLLLGALLFAFQIYGDFSGYSDIALGTARLLGIELLRNFGFPYFSRDIAEFWRRWHISLTTWFRDYLYIPLGGSRGTKWMSIRNTFVIFLVSGFWHGANWTFITWGAFHAILFMPLLIFGRNRLHTNSVAEGKLFPTFKELAQMIVTFVFVLIGWIFFRAPSLSVASHYIFSLFSLSLFTLPTYKLTILGFFIAIFLAVEWIQREKKHGLAQIESLVKYHSIRWAFYVLIILSIIQFGGKSETFIYFQF
ncbi:Membrane bound O-acyl transferase MBOAT family protein [uncultured Paludibacter sp.]|uniref:Membrane bound O-acyl transferase MBOAT family protein n=1 Tax=uncultured Paludibacter sp. TaxID=497635 RepID=A0A653A9D6_9BACT|nr:Membrane bound O-acyl transferase MBOAT family protein [uncultured Paludibacter sp.]